LERTSIMTHGTFRLFIEINAKGKRQIYQVTPIPADTRVSARAWRLTTDRIGEPFYDVAIMMGTKGTYCDCTCPDGTYRNPGNCKHIRSLKAVGLLPQAWSIDAESTQEVTDRSKS
jgi:hypothetical protein